MSPRFPLPVVLVTLLFVASQANLALLLKPLEPSVFALQLAFTPDAFNAVLARWGEPGLALYRSHFQYDNLHPFIYGLFGYLLARRSLLFARLPRPVVWSMPWILPLAGAFDLAENLFHLNFLGHLPANDCLMIVLSASCSSVKWLLAGGYAAVTAACCARAMARRLQFLP